MIDSLNLKILLGFLSAIITFIAYFSYTKDAIQGKIRPHLITWIIWSIVTVVVFIIQIFNNAGAGSWGIGITALLSIIISIVAVNNPRKPINKLDKVCLSLTLFSILLLKFTSNHLYSIFLLSLVNSIGFIPTIKKSLLMPHEESLLTFFLFAIRNIFSLFALDEFSWINILYALSSTVGNIIVTLVLIYKRSKSKFSA